MYQYYRVAAAVPDMRVADTVEQRRLAVVDMAHDHNHRAACCGYCL